MCFYRKRKKFKDEKRSINVVEMGEKMKEGRNDKTFYVILIDFFSSSCFDDDVFVSFALKHQTGNNFWLLRGKKFLKEFCLIKET